MDRRARKRWAREHRRKEHSAVQLVYRSKTPEEGQRRAARAVVALNTPFVALPGITDHSAVLFTAKDGTPIPAEAVEMVFNDALLMDAVSDWGKDGPLYVDTLGTDAQGVRQREVYDYAVKAYAGVDIPTQLRNPGTQ